MIGVIARPADIPLVEEFFQLFKTPWEFFMPGKPYSAVIATAEPMSAVQAGVLLVFASGQRSGDSALGCQLREPVAKAWIGWGENEVPLYGALGIIGGAGKGVVETRRGASGPAGVKIAAARQTVYRIGYDLFEEVAVLLKSGQPVGNAGIPALELHIKLLRDCLQTAGVSFVEIPPVPAEQDFIVSLTHDIDFVGIRRHHLDHTILGFLYRSTIGSVRDLARGRIKFRRALAIWWAVIKLPFVYLHLAKDFWSPFEWYLEVEKNLPATYYLIPFKHRAGDRLSVRHATRRASPYDITDIPEWVSVLLKAGCEIGVHGIDSWHSVDLGREELKRIREVVGGDTTVGIRMHWLLRHENTNQVLEEAGYGYDSTCGYNETIGYLAGTPQVFRPCSAGKLLELPMLIQDGALFYHNRLNLSDEAAWQLCQPLLANAQKFGGVLTLLWHDRSHGPERFWGGFYDRLVQHLRAQNVWFASAGQAVEWFRARREIQFERPTADAAHLRLKRGNSTKTPVRPFRVRLHRACFQPDSIQVHPQPLDMTWNAESDLHLDNPETTCLFPRNPTPRPLLKRMELQPGS